jgi:hypothetical protein
MRREDARQQPAWCLPLQTTRLVLRSAEVKPARPRPVAPPQLAGGLRTKWVCIGFAPADEYEGVVG